MPQLSPGNLDAPGGGEGAREQLGEAPPAGSPAAASGAKVEDAAESKGPKKPAGDFLGTQPPKPTGAQAEEAEFAKDGGTVPKDFAPSGGGPVPLGSLSEAEQKRALELKRSDGRLPDDVRLDEEDLEGMTAPELKAVGASRGYKMPDAGGRKAMQRVFLREQEKDPDFGDDEDDKE